MAKEILVLFDRVGNTLDVWFGEPREAVCEEIEEEFLIKKDIKTGEIVGFEKFNLLPLKEERAIPEVKFVVKEKV